MARSDPPSIVSGRWPSVVSTRAPMRPSGSAILRHRATRERSVAREREGSALPGEDPGEQPDERAGVGAVDRPVRGGEPRDARSAHEQRVRPLLLDLDPERAHRGDRRLRVRGAAETP